MLRQLEIVDYGLIERADIAFADGATVFTGETGSGKTMLLGALGFALGERAEPDVVRAGAAKAVVTLRFDPDAALRRQLDADGFALDPDEDATVVREVAVAGRSALRLNGRPATAAYVRELAASIAEIVGQHDAQRLLNANFHRDALDRFGGAATRSAGEAVARARSELDALLAEEREIARSAATARERAVAARALLADVEPAALTVGEDRQVRERLRVLDDAERIGGALRQAHEALAGDEGGAIGALGAAAHALHGIAGVGTELAALAERSAALQSEAREVATAIARALDAAVDDPVALEALNARSSEIERLTRRYGGSIEAVLAAADAARAALDADADRDAQAAAVAAAIARARHALVGAAAELTAIREAAARGLEASIGPELAAMALGSARFAVALEPLDEIGAHGAERVLFSFAANAGQPLRPLARVASGGELARVLLGLILTMAERDDGVALVFDEVDAGIGGATAAAVGQRIARLAQVAQVLCITHLAPIATAGRRHYVLEKREARGATTIGVRELTTPAEREAEIARMLSGEAHPVALRHARALLEGR